MSQVNRRLAWVDLARSFAIFFVVYRHVVIGITRVGLELNSFWFNVQEWTFNFRMPLFFILSGIFLEMALKNASFGKVLLKRVGNVLYPYFIWGSLTIFIQAAFARFSNSDRHITDVIYLLTQPRRIDHFWYLLALFNTNVLYILVRRFEISPLLNLVFGLILYFVASLSFVQDFSLVSDLFYFYIYVSAGAVISERILRRQMVVTRSSVGSAIACVFMLVFIQLIWFRNKEEISVYYLLLINLFSSFLFFRILEVLACFKLPQVLFRLGKYSLYIYVMHVIVSGVSRSALMLLFPGISGLIVLSVVFPLSLLLPVYLYRKAERWNLLYFFQVGK